MIKNPFLFPGLIALLFLTGTCTQHLTAAMAVESEEGIYETFRSLARIQSVDFKQYNGAPNPAQVAVGLPGSPDIVEFKPKYEALGTRIEHVFFFRTRLYALYSQFRFHLA